MVDTLQNRGPYIGVQCLPEELALLRLTIAAGSTLEVVRIACEHVLGHGNDAQEERSISAVGGKLGIAALRIRWRDILGR